MASCKDCVHYEVCQMHYKQKCELTYETEREVEIAMRKAQKAVDIECDYYKDRSRFVELPYPIKPHDKVWYILEGLSEIDLKDYEITKGDCAVGNNPDTVIEVGTFGFWVNQLSERNEDYLVPDDCDFISWDEIGKSYFLTKEAAEQALKEREHNA